MAYKWTPPPGYTTLEIPGNKKLYEPGEMVPISKHDAEHLVRFGHIFEGLDAPELPGPTGAPAPAPAKAD